MRYVQRDPATGEVTGHFSHPHPYASEEVADDHPEILAWRAKRLAAQDAYLKQKALTRPEVLLPRIAALEAELAKLKKG